MANVPNGLETLSKISTGWVGRSRRTNVTDDRSLSVTVDPKFKVEGVAPTNRSSSQETRLSDLSCGVKNLDRYFFRFVTIHAFDRRQTDGRQHKTNQISVGNVHQHGSRRYDMSGFSAYLRSDSFLPRCMKCRREWWESCPSVCLSVCQTGRLWQNGRKICPDFYTTRKITSLVSLEEEWLVGGWWGGDPFYLKFWVNCNT